MGAAYKRHSRFHARPEAFALCRCSDAIDNSGSDAARFACAKLSAGGTVAAAARAADDIRLDF